MRTLRSWLGNTLAVSAGVASILGTSLPVRAVTFADGSTHFAGQPRLVGASTSFNDAYFNGATYFFTLSLPADASEPLQTVMIAQAEGVDDARLYGNDTEAFEGTRNRSGARLSIKPVVVDRKARTITVTFDPPVPPGKTVTIALYPVRNPFSSGIYLYGVTAYPAGEKPAGQFLGYGRIQIYNQRFFFD